jgi:hypothetical protein
MNSKFLVKISSYAFVFSLFTFSCQVDEKISKQDTDDVKEEALTDAYFQDMDDIAGVAIASPSENQYNNGGRENAGIMVSDSRICNEAVVTLAKGEGSTLDHPKGTITVDFGTTGCTDLRGNTRTGKLLFTYDGKRFQAGSKIITTAVNYAISGNKIEGTRTITNAQTSSSAAPRFNIVLLGGKVTDPDNKVSERESNITLEWIRASNPTDDQLVVDVSSVASGKTKGGRTYNVSVLKPLKYKRFCGIAVEGTKKYSISGSPDIQVDYGNGDCDKSVLITVNGVSKTVRWDK